MAERIERRIEQSVRKDAKKHARKGRRRCSMAAIMEFLKDDFADKCDLTEASEVDSLIAREVLENWDD